MSVNRKESGSLRVEQQEESIALPPPPPPPSLAISRSSSNAMKARRASLTSMPSSRRSLRSMGSYATTMYLSASEELPVDDDFEDEVVVVDGAAAAGDGKEEDCDGAAMAVGDSNDSSSSNEATPPTTKRPRISFEQLKRIDNYDDADFINNDDEQQQPAVSAFATPSAQAQLMTSPPHNTSPELLWEPWHYYTHDHEAFKAYCAANPSIVNGNNSAAAAGVVSPQLLRLTRFSRNIGLIRPSTTVERMNGGLDSSTQRRSVTVIRRPIGWSNDNGNGDGAVASMDVDNTVVDGNTATNTGATAYVGVANGSDMKGIKGRSGSNKSTRGFGKWHRFVPCLPAVREE